MTRIRSESDEDLLELERDEQHAAALVALLDEPAVHELDRADVEAARRLRRDQHLRVAVDLAREHDLLLVAARERAGRRRGPPPRTSNSCKQPARPLDQPRAGRASRSFEEGGWS